MDPIVPLPGRWGIVPTTQRQHNTTGDQNPCSVRPCLKNRTAASVSCTFNFIRCYLRVGTKIATSVSCTFNFIRCYVRIGQIPQHALGPQEGMMGRRARFSEEPEVSLKNFPGHHIVQVHKTSVGSSCRNKQILAPFRVVLNLIIAMGCI